MKIYTPTGAAPATVAYFMQETGIGAKLEALRQKYGGTLTVTFYSDQLPVEIEVGGTTYSLDLPDMQLPGTLCVRYDAEKRATFRIETAEEIYTIINSHLNR